MKKITPWDKKSEQIFDSIVKNQRAYVDDIHFTRTFGRKYPDLFDKNNGFFDIGRIDKTRRSIIAPRIGVQVVPLPEPDSKSMNIRRRKKYGIYRL